MDKSRIDKLALAAIIASVAAIILAVLLAWLIFTPAQVEKKPYFISRPHDVPIMTYPEYRVMMNVGATTLDFDGREVIVYKSDFSINELQKLGLMLRVP